MPDDDAQMKRQSLVSYGAPLAKTESPIPVVTGTEVVIKIHHCGVCHSDVHLQDGYFDLGNDRRFGVSVLHNLPFTLGHEIEGEIAAIGENAEGVVIGERRVVYPWIGCEACDLCRSGQSHLCDKPRQIGINVDGGFATHVHVPHSRYLLAYDGIEAEYAGSFMCAGLTAFSALKKLTRRSEVGPVLIVGLGGVGMMALRFARALFEKPPIVAEIDAEKRAEALTMGAGQALDPGDRSQRNIILKETGGVTGAVDFVGNPKTASLAIGMLRKGGKLVVAGLYGGEFAYPLPYFPFRSVAIEGSYVGSLQEAKEMLDLVRSKHITPIPVTTRPLDDA
ncbi:MAG: alcohol dehydrogenase, partial [Methyloligellaceae bacterium]